MLTLLHMAQLYEIRIIVSTLFINENEHDTIKFLKKVEFLEEGLVIHDQNHSTYLTHKQNSK